MPVYFIYDTIILVVNFINFIYCGCVIPILAYKTLSFFLAAFCHTFLDNFSVSVVHIPSKCFWKALCFGASSTYNECNFVCTDIFRPYHNFTSTCITTCQSCANWRHIAGIAVANIISRLSPVKVFFFLQLAITCLSVAYREARVRAYNKLQFKYKTSLLQPSRKLLRKFKMRILVLLLVTECRPGNLFNTINGHKQTFLRIYFQHLNIHT